ncbi:MAG TPA: hypothetical protein VIG80_15740 [Bacillaceae bacterium]
MRNFLFMLFISVLGSTLSVSATSASAQEALLEYRHDVTGDGKPEKIIVYGIPFDDNAAFYKEIWAEIELPDARPLRIDYEGGYEPTLEFADLNHDGVDDILYSSATGGSGGLYNSALHTAINAEIQEIPLPESFPIEGAFQNEFKASLKIPGIRKPIILDLSDRKADYIASGVYMKNGQLNEPRELMVDPIAFFKIEKVRGKAGLRSFQQISGAYHADRLGTVEALWVYKKGVWVPKKVTWKPV